MKIIEKIKTAATIGLFGFLLGTSGCVEKDNNLSSIDNGDVYKVGNVTLEAPPGLSGNIVQAINDFNRTSICTDSDGRDYYTKGTTKGMGYAKIEKNNKYYKVNDTCKDDFTLIEYVCSDTSSFGEGYYPEAIGLMMYECLNGCKDGACLEEKISNTKTFCLPEEKPEQTGTAKVTWISEDNRTEYYPTISFGEGLLNSYCEIYPEIPGVQCNSVINGDEVHLWIDTPEKSVDKVQVKEVTLDGVTCKNIPKNLVYIKKDMVNFVAKDCNEKKSHTGEIKIKYTNSFDPAVMVKYISFGRKNNREHCMDDHKIIDCGVSIKDGRDGTKVTAYLSGIKSPYFENALVNKVTFDGGDCSFTSKEVGGLTQILADCPSK